MIRATVVTAIAMRTSVPAVHVQEYNTRALYLRFVQIHVLYMGWKWPELWVRPFFFFHFFFHLDDDFVI